MSKVAVIRGKGVINSKGDLSQKKLTLMFNRGFHLLTGKKPLGKNLSLFFTKNDKVGIKINTISGKILSTRPEVSLTLAASLTESGIQQKNIIIWDRTNRELKDAGYKLNMSGNGIRIFGTDTQSIGYDSELTSHLNIGSLFSTIQSKLASSSISLAVLKDHGMAGITGGMKNYFGAVHNPNKYHDTNCNPYIAELFDSSPVKEKHKISILDGLLVQYHLGPSYHPKWSKKCETLIFSQDPVAADFVGWQIIEKLRAKKGLSSLKEENREPAYLRTAETMGLGKANLKEIQIIKEDI